MRAEKHVEMLRNATGRLREVLMKEYPELTPVDHVFVTGHLMTLLHLSFHEKAMADQMLERAKKPAIIVPSGPING